MRSFQITLTFMLLERIEQWNEQSWPIHSRRKREAKLLSKAGVLCRHLLSASPEHQSVRAVSPAVFPMGNVPLLLNSLIV